jgi:hypothetical protein
MIWDGHTACMENMNPKLWLGNVKGSDDLGDLGIDGIILRYLKKTDVD